uniref:Uncharacterized protein n=1 Tax=Heterosigma akashiwo TaxID=2829 RepID=A0A7S3XLI8_HETAK
MRRENMHESFPAHSKLSSKTDCNILSSTHSRQYNCCQMFASSFDCTKRLTGILPCPLESRREAAPVVGLLVKVVGDKGHGQTSCSAGDYFCLGKVTKQFPDATSQLHEECNCALMKNSQNASLPEDHPFHVPPPACKEKECGSYYCMSQEGKVPLRQIPIQASENAQSSTRTVILLHRLPQLPVLHKAPVSTLAPPHCSSHQGGAHVPRPYHCESIRGQEIFPKSLKKDYSQKMQKNKSSNWDKLPSTTTNKNTAALFSDNTHGRKKHQKYWCSADQKKFHQGKRKLGYCESSQRKKRNQKESNWDRLPEEQTTNTVAPYHASTGNSGNFLQSKFVQSKFSHQQNKNDGGVLCVKKPQQLSDRHGSVLHRPISSGEFHWQHHWYQTQRGSSRWPNRNLKKKNY